MPALGHRSRPVIVRFLSFRNFYVPLSVKSGLSFLGNVFLEYVFYVLSPCTVGTEFPLEEMFL
jgi:hypothetical protein